ncbi:MAG: magnesium and cobalt transport protein CorA [Rhodoglobus sp.]
MPIVDTAIYRNGMRDEHPTTLELTFDVLRANGGFAWIGMYRPTKDELRAVASEFTLHPLAVEDALRGHQRPKVERYGEVLFLVLHPARYLDAPEEVEFGEVHVFIGPQFAITIRHAESPDLGHVRQRLERHPELLRLGPASVLYGVLDEVIDQYQPVIHGLENDIDEIENQLFGGDPGVSRRIYKLSGEAMSFQRATHPLIEIVASLQATFAAENIDVELQRNLRDVHDHTLKIAERADAFRVTLQNALAVHSTLVTQSQNEEMRALSQASIAQGDQVKKISGWAAILFAPSLIAAIYGMNFRFMPELDWVWGYPLALILMLGSGATLYFVFRYRGWL